METSDRPRRAVLSVEKHQQKRHAGQRCSKMLFGTYLDALRRLPVAVPSPEGFEVQAQERYPIGEGQPIPFRKRDLHKLEEVEAYLPKLSNEEI